MRGPVVSSAYWLRISPASATPEASPRSEMSSSQSPAAFGDGLKQLTKERGIHGGSIPRFPETSPCIDDRGSARNRQPRPFLYWSMAFSQNRYPSSRFPE